jgi:bacteriorhodopsin
VPTFTHFLDLPLLLVIVALGAMRPASWDVFVVGIILAVVVAGILTVLLPRLYPWSPDTSG